MSKKSRAGRGNVHVTPFMPGQRLNPGGLSDWQQHTSDFGRYAADEFSDAGSSLPHDWLTGDLGSESPLDYDLPTLSYVPAVAHPRQATPPVEVPPEHLYAYEVEDLLEFTAEEILTAWKFRSQCCGSIEAASELFALHRVLTGEDDSYAGPTAYLDHAEVREIFATAPIDGAVQDKDLDEALPDGPTSYSAVAPAMSSGLNLSEVRDLDIEGLKTAWANRPDSFSSLEAAAETLAILRSLNTTEPERPSFIRMMRHELIVELEDALPLEIKVAVPAPAVELALLNVDRRTIRTQASVVRPGQGNFRARLLERYGSQCCITGCKVDTLLEAAHIIPYRGDQSDDVSNGLLLRVDLHRLFDAHLVSINPATLAVEVASTVDDAGYQSLNGVRPFAFSPKPRVLFLEAHFRTFLTRPR